MAACHGTARVRACVEPEGRSRGCRTGRAAAPGPAPGRNKNALVTILAPPPFTLPGLILTDAAKPPVRAGDRRRSLVACRGAAERARGGRIRAAGARRSGDAVSRGSGWSSAAEQRPVRDHSAEHAVPSVPDHHSGRRGRVFPEPRFDQAPRLFLLAGEEVRTEAVR